MLKISILLSFLLLLITGKTWGQMANITATIINSENKQPVEGANITVLMGESAIYHTISDSTGTFTIPQNIYLQMSYVKISRLNFQDLIINKSTGSVSTTSQISTLGTFQIKPRAIELKEIKVRSKRRYSDTTKIDMSKKKFERSVMIDDIFSKEYGFSKDNNGRLYYKGDPVSGVEVNGGDFFGKNNLDLFHLLPALVLNNIEIVKTNIDTITNTTTLRPTVKIDLKFKEQYRKGMFGNANLGLGTLDRYLANTDLFGYNKTQQVSLVLNSNNTDAGENLILPPTVNFSASSNNVTTNNAKFTYNNILSKKVQVSFSARGKIEDKNFSSQSIRNDLDIHQFSTTTNSSSYKTYSLNDANFTLNYKIDPLNSINVIEKANYDHTRNIDSLNYQITADSLNSLSRQSRIRNSRVSDLKTEVLYRRKFSSKKGRSLNMHVNYNDNTYHINENDNVNSLDNAIANSYFVNANRVVNEKQLSLNAEFTEPLGEDSHLSFFTGYKNDKIDYSDHVNSDTTVNAASPAVIRNQYIQSGAKFHRTFEKVSFDGNITGILNLKDVENLASNSTSDANTFRVNMDVSTDFNINKKKSLALNYQMNTTYPDIGQLTNLNSTFDLVSQTGGNINLKPEDKQAIKVFYSIKNQSTLSFGAELDHFTSKFGYSINSLAGTIPSTMLTNVGDATTGSISFSLSKVFSDKHYINYNSSLSYQQQPSIVNNVLISNNGVSFYQSLSTTIPIKSLITFNPIVSTSFSRYFYGPQSTDIVTLTYSGTVALNIAKFQVVAYPLFNYNHTISSNTSFSMNGEIKRSFFKDYLVMWLQAYDIFNSFKYYNTYIAPTYTQTTKFSNLRRYVFLGFSYKFNNLK